MCICFCYSEIDVCVIRFLVLKREDFNPPLKIYQIFKSQILNKNLYHIKISVQIDI